MGENQEWSNGEVRWKKKKKFSRKSTLNEGEKTNKQTNKQTNNQRNKEKKVNDWVRKTSLWEQCSALGGGNRAILSWRDGVGKLSLCLSSIHPPTSSVMEASAPRDNIVNMPFS